MDLFFMMNLVAPVLRCQSMWILDIDGQSCKEFGFGQTKMDLYLWLVEVVNSIFPTWKNNIFCMLLLLLLLMFILVICTEQLSLKLWCY